MTEDIVVFTVSQLETLKGDVHATGFLRGVIVGATGALFLVLIFMVVTT